MKKTQLKNSILLFLAALIWGTAFVAQAKGADHVPGFTFTAARSFTGALFLIPVAFLSEKFKKSRSVSYSKLCGTDKVMRDHMAGPLTKAELIGGSVCGTALAMASNFQQIGISHTTVAKSGFLTALYVIIVPVIGIFLKKRYIPSSGCLLPCQLRGCIFSACSEKAVSHSPTEILWKSSALSCLPYR